MSEPKLTTLSAEATESSQLSKRYRNSGDLMNKWYCLHEETRYESETIWLFGNQEQIERYRRDYSIWQAIAPVAWFNPELHHPEQRRVILKDLYPQMED